MGRGMMQSENLFSHPAEHIFAFLNRGSYLKLYKEEMKALADGDLESYLAKKPDMIGKKAVAENSVTVVFGGGELQDYSNTVYSKHKEKLIRDIAGDVVAVGYPLHGVIPRMSLSI